MRNLNVLEGNELNKTVKNVKLYCDLVDEFKV